MFIKEKGKTSLPVNYQSTSAAYKIVVQDMKQALSLYGPDSDEARFWAGRLQDLFQLLRNLSPM